MRARLEIGRSIRRWTAAVFVGVAGSTACAQQTLFDAGPPETCLFGGEAALVGFSSGTLPSSGSPQRWAASPFALAGPSIISEIDVDGYDGGAPATNPAGNLTFSSLNYVIWRRTASNAPATADQVASGFIATASLGQGIPDPRSRFQNLMKFRLTVNHTLPPGSYYLTVYASGPAAPGGDANFVWFANAQPDAGLSPINTPIITSDVGGVFIWRSASFPTPGFARYTTAAFGIDPAPAQGPHPQNPQYLYNTAFTIIGGPAPCYANCDGSTSSPALNINDFVCFQSRFAAGDSYANCDGSTSPPTLNINDFICFQSNFAAGCL